MLESLINTINNVDVSLFYAINLGLQNYFLDIIMPIISTFGLPLFWVGICAILFIFGGNKGKKVAVLCSIAIFISFFLSEFLKYALDRPRPYTVLGGVHLMSNIGGYSLPSGHTITAFAGCTILGKEYGHLYLFLILASLIGFSRIYLGVHYPFDVILGAILGLLCSILILRLETPICNQIIKLKNGFTNRI
jgi:undecaprenyl-diphosphatase